MKDRKAPKRIDVTDQLIKTTRLIPAVFFEDRFQVAGFLSAFPFTPATCREVMSQVN
jgi:hypothetical protein